MPHGNVYAQKLRRLAATKVRYRRELIAAAGNLDRALLKIDGTYPAMQSFLAAQTAARSIHHRATHK